jgi:hypothetical protein
VNRLEKLRMNGMEELEVDASSDEISNGANKRALPMKPLVQLKL